MESTTPDSLAPRRTLPIALGLGLWLVVMVWNWPVALSFGDEVGYVGQARLFLQGRIRPTVEAPGIWHPTASGGLIAKYPLFHPLLLAPFIAVNPRSAFLLGIGTAIALVVCAARFLRRWGRDPLWALLLLAQPAISVLSRTLMADLLISVFLFGAYVCLQRNRLWSTALLVAATMATKPTGPLLAGLLLVGDFVSTWRDVRDRNAATIRRWIGAGMGFGLGILLIVAQNLLANGSPRYGYYQRFGPPSFEPRFLSSTGVAHAKSLLLNPPLLVVGIWPFWKRRDFGPIAVVVGLVGLMSIYFFVDWGRNWADSLVLSQRLILPAVVFLMVGYVICLSDLLSAAKRKFGAWIGTVCMAALILFPASVGQAIGSRHRRWQEAMHQGLVAVTEVAREIGTDRIALTPDALKYGLLFRGTTSMYLADRENPDAVLCATKNTSYRVWEVDYSCVIPGYERVRSIPGSDVLVRSDRAGRVRPR